MLGVAWCNRLFTSTASKSPFTKPHLGRCRRGARQPDLVGNQCGLIWGPDWIWAVKCAKYNHLQQPCVTSCWSWPAPWPGHQKAGESNSTRDRVPLSALGHSIVWVGIFHPAIDIIGPMLRGCGGGGGGWAPPPQAQHPWGMPQPWPQQETFFWPFPHFLEFLHPFVSLLYSPHVKVAGRHSTWTAWPPMFGLSSLLLWYWIPDRISWHCYHYWHTGTFIQTWGVFQ